MRASRLVLLKEFLEEQFLRTVSFKGYIRQAFALVILSDCG